jgi:hypothetical protein
LIEAGAVRPATSFALLWGDLLLVMRLADQPPQAAQEQRA